jgi:phosphodiester glycosidase
MRRNRHVLGGVIGILVSGILVNHAGAAIAVQPWRSLYQGVDLTVGTAEASDGRPQLVTAIRIDLTTPGIGFTSTPSNGGDPLDTTSQTTSQFLADSNTQVAINTSFYTPCCTSSPQNKNIIGLAITDGVLVSPAQPEARAALLIDSLNGAAFVNTVDDVFSLTGIDTALAGSNFLLGVGRDLPTSTDTIHPSRTLIGLGDRDTQGDNKLLYLVTIDVGLPGVSDGATRRESAEWLMRLGAHTGVNLDGGGSTLMAARDPDTNAITRLNGKLGGERSNANHLGVFAPPAVGTPTPLFTTLWFAGLPDHSAADFAPEDAVENPQPGSASARDDDYYFAGNYPAPIGTVTQDEPLANLERAVIRFDPPNDTQLRFHFNLTPEQADPLTEFRYLTAIFQQDGQGTKAVELELLFNGTPVTTTSLTEGEAYTSLSFTAADIGAIPGANEFTVRQIGGDANWTNFDFHRLDIKTIPEPGSLALLGILLSAFTTRPRRMPGAPL